MSYVEVEIKAKTVDLAVEAAMQELGVDDRDQLDVEIVQDAEKGFLGIGGQDAVVKVKRRPARRRRKDRRRNPKNEGQNQGKDRGKDQGKQQGRHQEKKQNASRSGKNGGERQKSQSRGKARNMNRQDNKDRPPTSDDRPTLPLEEQAGITNDFLEGLLDAYGLEGSVETTVEEDVIIVEINGEQTEALVGVRGSVRSALHELSRTVLQRYAQDTARLRLDVAGYAEKRRQALTIYAEGLISQLVADGGEITLEPMSPADRKVIHDAAAARDGVNSYSEGEAPRRYVVLAAKKQEVAAETAASSEEE